MTIVTFNLLCNIPVQKTVRGIDKIKNSQDKDHGMQKTSQIQMNLLDNCINFIEEGLRKSIAAETNPFELKFSVFCLVQAVELSLKELLRRAHPVLVYADVDKMSRTVTIEQAAIRLNRMSNIQIDSKDKEAIQKAALIRNEIVHYSYELSATETKLILARLLGFLTHFCRKHLEIDLSNRLDENIWLKSIDIENFSNELVRRSDERCRLENIDQSWNWYCPKCDHETFVHFNGINECYVCGHKENVISCNKCCDEFLESETTSIDEGNMKGHVVLVPYCKKCYDEKTMALEEDSEYSRLWVEGLIP
jgi:hypothetical protein